ncbi:hypothetical protein PIB30_069675 [Stylosanthes scabra]|uniref:Uncharacterized protein n=1 Tax=Stylosanthes scabra TaxID=79078 RepID=A0ABU6SPP2_9FABA|nr:hypothetical protein [Stylosanthes scabra]
MEGGQEVKGIEKPKKIIHEERPSLSSGELLGPFEPYPFSHRLIHRLNHRRIGICCEHTASFTSSLVSSPCQPKCTIKEKAVAFQDAKAMTKIETLGFKHPDEPKEYVAGSAAQKAKEYSGDAAEAMEYVGDAAQEKFQAYVSGAGEYSAEKARERKDMAAQRTEHPIQPRLQRIYGLFYQQLLQAVLMASSLPAKAAAYGRDLHRWWTFIRIGMLSHP